MLHDIQVSERQQLQTRRCGRVLTLSINVKESTTISSNSRIISCNPEIYRDTPNVVTPLFISHPLSFGATRPHQEESMQLNGGISPCSTINTHHNGQRSGESHELEASFNLYRNGPVEILPNIYLGSERNGQNAAQLAMRNIGFILNVAEECKRVPLQHASNSLASTESAAESVEYLNLPWSHNHHNMIADLPKAFAFIEAALHLNKSILIHCKLGLCRSAALATACIMKYQQITFNSALNHLASKCPHINPNMGFIFQLMEFEKTLFPTPPDSD